MDHTDFYLNFHLNLSGGISLESQWDLTSIFLLEVSWCIALVGSGRQAKRIHSN